MTNLIYQFESINKLYYVFKITRKDNVAKITYHGMKWYTYTHVHTF